MRYVGQLDHQKLTITPWSIVFVGGSLIGLYLLLPRIGELKRSLAVVAGANVALIFIAILLITATIMLSAYAQHVAAARRGEYKKLLIIELAGSFFNHFFPYSIGVVALAQEYYTQLTRKRTYAIYVAILPILASTAVSVIGLIVISPITIVHIANTLGDKFPTVSTLTLSISLIGLSAGIVILRNKIRSTIRTIVHAAQMTRRTTIAAVLGVSLVQIILNAGVLWLVAASLNLYGSLFDCFIFLLVSNFIGNVGPTPGGIAITEAALVVSLSSVGITLPDAVAVTLLYRLLTFWLPLIPGGWALTKLNGALARE